MKKEHVLRTLSAVVVASVVLLASCSKSADQVLTSTDTQSVNSEAASSSYTDEGTNMSGSAVGNVSQTYLATGRGNTAREITGLGDKDNRLKCAVITLVANGTKDVPNGTITIDFGTAGTCADNENVVRKGKIVINYHGKKWVQGSYVATHFVDYFRNTVQIAGTDSTVVVSADSANNVISLKHHSILTGGQITFADGKTITRSHDMQRQWSIDLLAPLNTTFTNLQGGTATGKGKNTKTYNMTITADLVTKVSCIPSKVFIPVSGTKTIAVDGGNTYTVDYGSGDCDNLITISVNGKSKTIAVDPDGN